MTQYTFVTIAEAAASTVSEILQAGLVGDLSGLSQTLRGNEAPASLKVALDNLAATDNDINRIGILQDASGESLGTIQKTFSALQQIATAADSIIAAGKEAILGNVQELRSVRHHLCMATQDISALEWESFAKADLDCWADPPLGEKGVEWVEKIFAQPIDDLPAVEGSIFSVLMVWQHLRYLLGLEDETEWRTVSTPVLGAEAGGSGGLRMLLTVSLIPSLLESFIPDLRYFGLTELKHGTQDHCLLASAQRCWAAAQVSGYRGIWRMEHVGTASAADMTVVPHIYGRSFEAAFVCCLRAAFGNAYGEDPPKDEFERKKLLELDPLSTTVAISASLGNFDPQTTVIKDIPLIPVAGVPQKLCEARGTEITQVVFAANQWNEQTTARLSEKDRDDLQRSQLVNQAPENQSRLQWSTAASIGAALDALLVRSRWLKAWQKEARHNWLKRWEGRPKSEAGEFTGSGARAPEDDDPGPDDDNKPVANVVAGEDKTAESKAEDVAEDVAEENSDDNAGSSNEQFERETR